MRSFYLFLCVCSLSVAGGAYLSQWSYRRRGPSGGELYTVVYLLSSCILFLQANRELLRDPLSSPKRDVRLRLSPAGSARSEPHHVPLGWRVSDLHLSPIGSREMRFEEESCPRSVDSKAVERGSQGRGMGEESGREARCWCFFLKVS